MLANTDLAVAKLLELLGELREAQIPNPWGEERVVCAQGATGDAIPCTAKAANAAAGIKSRIARGWVAQKAHKEASRCIF